MLIVVTSILLLELFFCGFFIYRLFSDRRRSSKFGYVELFCSLGLGVLVNLSLVLLTFKLWQVQVCCIAFSLAGLVWFATSIAKKKLRTDFRAPVWKASVLGAAWLSLCVFTLLSPYGGWDSRSEWFFMGKIIYYADGLTTDIQDPSLVHQTLPEHAIMERAGPRYNWVPFANSFYPKLIGALSSQAAWLRGFWNNFAPKASLVVLFTLWFLGFLANLETGGPTLWLFIALFSVSFWGFLDAYLDCYLCAFTCVAYLFWGRYLKTRKPELLHAIAIAFGVMISLKEEGLVLAGLSAALMVGWMWYEDRKLLVNSWRSRQMMAFSALALAPALLWQFWKWKHPSVGDNGYLGPDTLRLIVARARHFKSFKTIAYCLLFNGEFARVLVISITVAATAAFAKKWNALRAPMVVLPAVAMVVYLAILTFAYLDTPYDFIRMVGLTANRLSEIPVALCLISIYGLVAALKET